jgi:hypothetical protein
MQNPNPALYGRGSHEEPESLDDAELEALREEIFGKT